MRRTSVLSIVLALTTAFAATTVSAAAAVAPVSRAPASAPAPADPVPSPPCVPRVEPPTPGLRLVDDQPLTGRLHELTFDSAAMGREVHTDVLLPEGYDPHGQRRYPVLLLLHGHGGRYTDWPDHGVEQIVGDRPLIVVMPDGGYDGWYSDWYGTDRAGGTDGPPAPAWETFHLDELLPWVESHYAAVGTRAGRFVAGLSMGGFGAMSYAARHPDRFAVAGSFSGAVDTTLYEPVGPVALPPAVNLPDGRQPDECIWGDPVTHNARWHGHDPTSLAANLADTVVYQVTGNGVPGPYDDPSSPNPGGMALEQGIWHMNRAFDRALTNAGVAHTAVFHPWGTHSWPYWQDDLSHFLDDVLAPAMAHPRPTPPAVPFSYRATEAAFSIWGFDVQVDRDVEEWLTLTHVTSAGFTVGGSGTVSMVTAPWYRPLAAYEVTGLGTGDASVVRADVHGRLHLTVDLGPADRVPPPVGAADLPTARRTVTILPARARTASS